MKTNSYLGFLVGLLALGCAGAAPTPDSPPERTEVEPAPTRSTAMPAVAKPRAEALLAATSGNTASGTLRLYVEDGGVRVVGTVTGLQPGAEHGFHVHEKGDCSAPDASSAGAHFNPEGHVHGRQGADQHHLGDMNNLVANERGEASVDFFVARGEVGTTSERDLVGRGVIVHGGRDDYTSQPAGNAGPRIACGVIIIVE